MTEDDFVTKYYAFDENELDGPAQDCFFCGASDLYADWYKIDTHCQCLPYREICGGCAHASATERAHRIATHVGEMLTYFGREFVLGGLTSSSDLPAVQPAGGTSPKRECGGRPPGLHRRISEA